MEILNLRNQGIRTYTKEKKNGISLKSRQDNNETVSKNAVQAYPANYYVSFCGTKTLREIFSDENYIQEVPTTVLTCYNELDSSIKSSLNDFPCLKDFQQYSFADLEECKNIYEIQKAFPNEKYFKDLKTPKQVCQEKGFIHDFNEVMNKEGNSFDSETDITTFLVKKLFFDCETILQTSEDLRAAIKGNGAECDKLRENISNNKVFNNYVLAPLGIKIPNGRTYGATMRYSNPKFRTKYSEAISEINIKKWSSLTPDEIQNKIDILLESTQKSRISMIDAWNNCPDIRETLSNFINENYAAYKSDVPAYQGSYNIFFDTELSGNFRMRKLMIDFWNKNPELKKELGAEIKKAKDLYDKKKAAGTEVFERYKDSVINRNKEIKIQINSAKKDEKNYKKARILTDTIAQKINPMYLKTKSTAKDFSDMLFNSFSKNELAILEGSDDTEEYRNLFPEGIIMRINDIVKSNQFWNLLDAQIFALLFLTDEKDMPDSLQDKEKVRELFAKSAGKAEAADEQYNKFKQNLSKNEYDKIKTELFKYCTLNQNEKIFAENYLAKKGKYMNLIFDDKFKQDIILTFWSEVDEINKTKKTKEVETKLLNEKNYNRKSDLINNFDFEKYLSSIIF